jgi:hypothetical protein
MENAAKREGAAVLDLAAKRNAVRRKSAARKNVRLLKGGRW